MPFSKFKGGKLPPKRPPRMVSLSDHLDRAATWPSVPARGWEFAVPTPVLNILGNDQWGDCGEAGALGLAQAQSWNTGKNLVPTTEQALAVYSAVTGFNQGAGLSGSNPTDNGTVLTDLLTYWQKTGIPINDSNGKETIHQIVGWAALDITSVAQRRWATFTFGGSYLGINCPQSAEDDTSNWTVVAGSPIVGGHCVVQIGEGAAGGKTRSWGMFIPTTNGFYAEYLDEGYIVVTPDWLNAQDQSPTGLDLNGLVGAMKQL